MGCGYGCNCNCGCSGYTQQCTDINVAVRNNDAATTLQGTNLASIKLAADLTGQVFARVQGRINEGSPDVATIAPVIVGALCNDSINGLLQDNGGIAKLLTDLTRRLVTTEFPIADERHGTTGYFTGAVTATIIAAQGAGYRLMIGEITLTSREAAIRRVQIGGSLGTAPLEAIAPITDTRTFTFPKGLALADNEALQVVLTDTIVTGLAVRASGYVIRVA